MIRVETTTQAMNGSQVKALIYRGEAPAWNRTDDLCGNQPAFPQVESDVSGSQTELELW